MTTTIPSPTRTMGRERSIRNRFVIATEADGSQSVVDVDVSHNKDRKQFVATATRKNVRREGAFNVEAYEPLRDILWLTRTPVARYSATALAAFESDVMADFPTYVAQDARLTGWFTS